MIGFTQNSINGHAVVIEHHILFIKIKQQNLTSKINLTRKKHKKKISFSQIIESKRLQFVSLFNKRTLNYTIRNDI